MRILSVGIVLASDDSCNNAEAWRCEYNEERPKKGLGGLTPALYAKQLAAEGSTVTPGL